MTTLLNPIIATASLDAAASQWVLKEHDFEKNRVILADDKIVGPNWEASVLPDGRLAQVMACPAYRESGETRFIFVERRVPRKGDSVMIVSPATVGGKTYCSGITGKVCSVVEGGKHYLVQLENMGEPVELDRAHIILTTKQRKGGMA